MSPHNMKFSKGSMSLFLLEDNKSLLDFSQEFWGGWSGWLFGMSHHACFGRNLPLTPHPGSFGRLMAHVKTGVTHTHTIHHGLSIRWDRMLGILPVLWTLSCEKMDRGRLQRRVHRQFTGRWDALRIGHSATSQIIEPIPELRALRPLSFGLRVQQICQILLMPLMAWRRHFVSSPKLPRSVSTLTRDRSR